MIGLWTLNTLKYYLANEHLSDKGSGGIHIHKFITCWFIERRWCVIRSETKSEAHDPNPLLSRSVWTFHIKAIDNKPEHFCAINFNCIFQFIFLLFKLRLSIIYVQLKSSIEIIMRLIFQLRIQIAHVWYKFSTTLKEWCSMLIMPYI